MSLIHELTNLMVILKIWIGEKRTEEKMNHLTKLK